MSEEKSRFRIKKGDIEIEYEGKSSEVNLRYREAFDWIKTGTIIPPKHEHLKEGKKKKKEPETQQDKRGGVRSNIVSKAIDELVTEGWLDTPRKTSDVLGELQRRTVPGAKLNTVRESLKRRVPKVLDRIRDTDRKWTYVRKKP